jgi:hypothetical protein
VSARPDQRASDVPDRAAPVSEIEAVADQLVALIEEFDAASSRSADRLTEF